jgi:hypothetical protein
LAINTLSQLVLVVVVGLELLLVHGVELEVETHKRDSLLLSAEDLVVLAQVRMEVLVVQAEVLQVLLKAVA